MSDILMDPCKFNFESGELCLDFANTVDWHISTHPEDRLHSYRDLIDWACAAKILSVEEAGQLINLAEQEPVKATDFYQCAIALREVIYRIFAGVATCRICDINPSDLAILNQYIQEASSHRRIVNIGDKFEWQWDGQLVALDKMVWCVARSAADLLSSTKLKQVGQCQDDRGCGWLFIDTSRNHSRRWCSMESCGNRAKAQRHYGKTVKARSGKQ